MFAKVLIANRGEIARRVMQTCAEMGIATVAVYSDADAGALHVRHAAESYRIGPAPASASYLNVDAILDAARRSGAEAIHPGYGFLSENPRFAEACRDAGIVFVGPPPEAMRLLGSKQAAKALARREGVPVVPGYDGADQDPDALAQEAQRLGFPLLIKASAGGGGRGMRAVSAAGEFREALESARREAQSAFGDGTVLLERLVPSPRHVEFQVLADTHGNVVHLGERECSVQRRHQKVIEESPSPALTPDLRARMGRAAVQLMRAAGYLNTGTVEFMLTPTGDYFFLEVNTRLQVEHPVTEQVVGLDLVREQLRIAAGLPLSLQQEDVRLRGHAIECRIYAEDPGRNFQPSTGRLLLFDPPLGAGLRHDCGVETGDEVTPFYDPMLAKLIATAASRDACLARALGALGAYAILGVTTNLPLLTAVLGSDAFRAGRVSTDFLDQRLTALLPPAVAAEEALSRSAPSTAAQHKPGLLPDAMLVAAAGWRATAAMAPATAQPHSSRAERSPWRPGAAVTGQSFQARYLLGAAGGPAVSGQRQAGGAWHLDLPGGRRELAFERAGATTLLVRDGAQTWTARIVETADALHVGLAGHTYTLYKPRALAVDDLDLGGATATGPAAGGLQAPFPGVVVKVHVRAGDVVDAGQPLLVLEAMKTELSIAAPHPGTVKRLPYRVGDLVQAGAVLAEVSP